MEKERILFILHLPPPIHGSSVVGKQIFDSTLINEQFDCLFVNLSTSSKITQIGKVSLSKLYQYFFTLFRIFRILLLNSIDKVYLAPTVSGPGFFKDYFVYIILFLFRKKRVFHLHNKGVSRRRQGWLTSWLYRSFFKGAKVILLSKRLYEDIYEFVDEEDIFLCPNGVKDELGGYDLRINKKDNHCNLLFLSNLIESKGVFVLLEACKALKEKRIDFICNFVGGEGDISKGLFAKRVKDMGLENHVFYLGKKYNQDKNEIFVSSDIFVFPTYNEVFPLVNLEAMMYGLPVVSTDEGGILDMIENGYNGYIIPKGDVKALVEKIITLIENDRLRKEIGKNGREKFLKEYTLEKFEVNLLNILVNI